MKISCMVKSGCLIGQLETIAAHSKELAIHVDHRLALFVLWESIYFGFLVDEQFWCH